jgi:DnaJ-class molecular chaperone
MSDNLYEVLGVSKKADPEEIKKAYRDLSKIHHPDKGGDPEKFKELNNAYEILKDSSKREMYDLTGQTQEGGPPPGGPGFGSPFGFSPFGPGFHMNVDIGDLFGNMFRGRNNQEESNKHHKKPKGPNRIHEMPISLKDFYHGKKININLNRQVFCSDCQGEGCLNWKTCAECKGAGVKETRLQQGPFIQIIRGACGSCSGEGRMKGKECEGCKGKGLVNVPKTLEVVVQPGAAPGEVLKFEEMCSDQPGFEKPGDFHIRLVAADEDLDIEREGQNLKTKVSISLAEALVGCKRVVADHPGGPVEVEIPCGTMSGETVVVNEKGMLSAQQKGDLYVHVTVAATSAEKKTLEANKAILQGLFWNFS